MERYVTTRQGKKLFCRVEGSGRPLLLIHGSIVDADFYADVSRLLSRFFKVISYDRRGYSRSEECEDYSLPMQAEDAAEVLGQLAGGKAVVVGCSLGALIAMRLTALYPGLVDFTVLHEPPLLCLPGITSPEEDEALEEMRSQVERGKYKLALLGFLNLTNGREDPRAKPYPPEKVDQQLKNGMLFMQHEYSDQFFLDRGAYGVDALRDRPGLLCTAGDSSGETYTVKAARDLAAELGCPLYYVPGGHNAAHDMPAEFAAALIGLLALSEGGNSGGDNPQFI